MTKDIIKLTLSEQIYNILKDDILTGNIHLGDKLTNRELQERFQVSSTPVRDAINKLYQDGLVKDVTKTGAQLISFDPEYAEEINEFIASMSGEAMHLSTQKGDRQQIVASLYKYQELMELADNDDAYFDADFRFHKTFFDHCGNRFLKETYKRYNLIRFLLIRYAVRTSTDRITAIRQHKEITEAYVSDNYELSIKLLIEHYRYGARLINGYFSIQE